MSSWETTISSCPFNLLEPTTFARGSYITYKGRKFEIMSTVRPEFDNKTGGYKYTLKFEAQQNHMKRFGMPSGWVGTIPKPYFTTPQTSNLSRR